MFKWSCDHEPHVHCFVDSLLPDAHHFDILHCLTHWTRPHCSFNTIYPDPMNHIASRVLINLTQPTSQVNIESTWYLYSYTGPILSQAVGNGSPFFWRLNKTLVSTIQVQSLNHHKNWDVNILDQIEFLWPGDQQTGWSSSGSGISRANYHCTCCGCGSIWVSLDAGNSWTKAAPDGSFWGITATSATAELLEQVFAGFSRFFPSQPRMKAYGWAMYLGFFGNILNLVKNMNIVYRCLYTVSVDEKATKTAEDQCSGNER